MTCAGQSVARIQPYVASRESVELFPESIKVAFDRIEDIAKGRNAVKPSQDNIEWAKRVLLRVLPRHYLSGAEIDAFEREIHVNWQNKDKRVTVFLPAPDQIKIYYEGVEDGQVKHGIYNKPNANDPHAVSGVLRWMFS